MEPLFSRLFSHAREFDTKRFRFIYESLVTPRTWYEYEVATRKRTLLKQQPVLGDYDPKRYESLAFSARAKDGTKVPISLVYRKSLRGGQAQPLLLYGYGSYGFPMDPWFSPSRISLLDQPGSVHTAPALDVAVLESLVGDDPQVVSEFLEAYRTSVGRLAIELRAARAADDIRQIGAIAHKLKSSSRSVGALVMGDLCAELENACRSGARESIAQGVVKFEAALRAVDAQIDRLTTVGPMTTAAAKLPATIP